MRRLERVSEQLSGVELEGEPPLDLVILGGRVIDPANNLDGIYDLAVRDGVIVAVETSPSMLGSTPAAETFVAAGLLITPGLVDIHAHGFQHVEPIGLDFDASCLQRCTTTVVDAGSSGATHFPGFRKFIIDACKTRVLSFLNISLIGAGRAPAMGDAGPSLGGDGRAEGGGLQSPAHISVDHCVDCIQQNSDVIVGIKIALSRSWASEFPGGPEAGEAAGYKAALEASERAGVPLMTHHTMSSVPLSECPGRLRAGDIYTHCLHGFESTLITPSGEIDPAAVEAQARGVRFDVGHGMGSFSWTVAERCMAAGFPIHTISTDLWNGNVDGPAYDLPTVMSKCLALGMALQEVIKAATATPAATIGFADRVGSLGVGRCADIAVLELRDVDMELEDSQSQMRRVKQLLLPHACWRAGVRVAGVSNVLERPFPNPISLARQYAGWKQLLVRDSQPPHRPSTDGGVTTSGAAASSVFASMVSAVRPDGRADGRCQPCDSPLLVLPDRRHATTVFQPLELEPQWPGGPLVPKNKSYCC